MERLGIFPDDRDIALTPLAAILANLAAADWSS
jgi:hypothetical protein